MNNERQTPKVIHYCWFGGSPLPELARRCLDSWRKFCPNYEIIEWNETNYDIHTCPFVHEAYQSKKWAFVSDYARFDILYRHGGVYFDTDVELVGPIDDLVEKGPFLGVEQNADHIVVNPGLAMATPPGHPVYQSVLETYQNGHFINEDGTYNQMTVVKYTTDILRAHGLLEIPEVQCIEGIWIYPWNYFCPMNYETGELTITENTRSVHYYNASWLTDEEKASHSFGMRMRKLFGNSVGNVMEGVYSLPYRVKAKVRQKGLLGALRFAIRKIVKQ